MSGWREWTDAVDPWTAEDIEEFQRQSILHFDDASSRDSQLTSDIRRRGMMTFCSTEGTYEAWDGSAWRVVDSLPLRNTVSATPTTDTSAANANIMTTFLLPAAGTYRIHGLIRVVSGTCNFTSLMSAGTLTNGYWGNLRNGQDAALFDKTSADAILTMSTGLNVFTGDFTSASAIAWTVYGYNNAGSATIGAPSYIEVRRIA